MYFVDVFVLCLNGKPCLYLAEYNLLLFRCLIKLVPIVCVVSAPHSPPL